MKHVSAVLAEVWPKLPLPRDLRLERPWREGKAPTTKRAQPEPLEKRGRRIA